MADAPGNQLTEDTELQHLIKMINQIADNLGHGEEEAEVAAAVLVHLNRFWAPSMKQKLVQYEQQDGAGLQAAARRAVKLLAQE
jgi:formate dehydrogenase subunit delta